MNNRYEKITLDKFSEMVNDHNSQLVDVHQSPAQIQYKGIGHLVASEDTGLGIAQIAASMNKVAYRQWCQRLNLPHQWLISGKCPPDLEKSMVNRMATDNEKNMLFRFKNIPEEQRSECRAVLSDKYLVYNHHEFWTNIQDSIQGTGLEDLNPVIWKPSVSHHLDAWILFDNVSADPQDGESPSIYDNGGFGGLRPAIHIKNTEDGTGMVRIDSGLFRSYCTNGVIFGWKSENAMAAEHLGKSTAHMQLKVTMAIADAASTCKLGIDKFVEATKVKIKENAISLIVKEWTRTFSIAAGTSTLWETALQGSQTWGDVVMATSDFAGSLPDRDMTTTLEEMSGAILFAGAPPRYRAS